MKRVSSRVLAFLLALTVVTASVELPVMATEVNTEVVETEVVETEVIGTEVVETEVVETEVVETEVVETEVVETEVVETEVVEIEVVETEVVETEVVETEVVETEVIETEVIETEVVETEVVETEVVETEVVEIEVIETEAVETEVVETEETTETETDSWDGVTEESVYEADNYTVTFKLTGAWDGGYNANVRIDNTGDTPIESWKMAVSYDGNISNIWNAVIESSEEGKYVLKNAGWNQDIAVDSYVEFGLSGQESFGGFPTVYEMLGGKTTTEEEDYTVEYIIQSDWGTGFSGLITISNNTDVVIEDWILEFDGENEITNIWNAVIETYEENHYVVKNAGYNQNIAAGESVSFGFNVSDGCSTNAFTNFVLSQYSDEEVVIPEQDDEPLIDIGEIYFEDIEDENDIAYNADNGMPYVKNQLLISGLEGADKEVFEVITKDLGAEIVGFIELTNDYQIEFATDMTWEELENKRKYLESFSFVESVTPNVVIFSEENMTTTNDAIYNTKPEGDDYNAEYEKDGFWNEALPYGYNWSLEAMKVPSAWDVLKSVDNPNSVKMGLIDSGFDNNHQDLSFVNIFGDNSQNDKNHGTHVAGIMAAKHNNGIGVSGVATNVRLYGYANGSSNMNSLIEYKIALSHLVGNHVKVINISQGYDNVLAFAASQGNRKAQTACMVYSDYMTSFLRKLVEKGYDFLLVVAAGNENNLKFVEDSTELYGYRWDESATNYLSGDVLAKYSSIFAGIDNPMLMKRIIVVGGIENDQVYSAGVAEPWYEYAEYSNIGERVDVCAPGTDIASTVYNSSVEDKEIVDGYALKRGTSMAAPHIAGLAGLIYQANPGLSAYQVKEIICDSANSVSTVYASGSAYSMPDASLCIETAVATDGNGAGAVLPSGVLIGKVVDKHGEALRDVKITAYRTSVGDSNLDNYSTTCKTDMYGSYEMVLTQGTYNLHISCEGYLPFVLEGVEVLPDETKYMENTIMNEFLWNDWFSNINGSITNALNGQGIANATVKLRTGWNNKEGDYVTDKNGSTISTVTDTYGAFTIKLPVGAYTLEVVKEGFVTGYYNVVSSSGSSNQLQALVMTPVLSDDEYRIVLTWGEIPSDLDSHLLYYKDGVNLMHVYYGNRYGIVDGEKIAELDRDDVTSYGPETVTITLRTGHLDGGVFKYYVHNFSARNYTDLSASGAVVRVYKGNDLLQTYSVPQNLQGIYWFVFDITEDGLVAVNEIR